MIQFLRPTSLRLEAGFESISCNLCFRGDAKGSGEGASQDRAHLLPPGPLCSSFAPLCLSDHPLSALTALLSDPSGACFLSSELRLSPRQGLFYFLYLLTKTRALSLPQARVPLAQPLFFGSNWPTPCAGHGGQDSDLSRSSKSRSTRHRLLYVITTPYSARSVVWSKILG